MNKKSQTEIIGILFIMIVLVIIVLFYFTNSSPNNTLSIQQANIFTRSVIDAIMNAQVSIVCDQEDPNIGELWSYCLEQSTYCNYDPQVLCKLAESNTFQILESFSNSSKYNYGIEIKIQGQNAYLNVDRCANADNYMVDTREIYMTSGNSAKMNLKICQRREISQNVRNA